MSGGKKSKAPRIPYTPPAARRSAASTSTSTSNNSAETPRTTHDADRSSSKQPAPVTAIAEGNHVGSPAAAVQPAAERERVGAGTRPEENGGGERLERTRADTCKPTIPPSRGGVDRKASPAAKVVSAGSESRRKPRQAWAQYVPPGRRGSARSNESEQSSAPESKPSKRTEESASGGSSNAPVGGGRQSLSQQAAQLQHRTSNTVVADEPVVEERTSAGAPTTASSLLKSSNNCEGSCAAEPEPALPPEEGQASVSSPPSPSPAPSPPPPLPETTSTVAQEVAGATYSPVAYQKSQGGEGTSHIPTSTSATVPGVVETPCSGKEATTTATGATGATKSVDKEDQELPPLKPPTARYIPPGRRRALDAEAAAGGGDGAAGDGVGPLWTSRAPVRVSQRERPTDKDASAAARPAPARVARVVSGGMSAYGANISEYSEEMSREDVEACTAVVSNFPSALPPGQRDSMLQPFVALGGLVVWPRPDEALVTFATPALARQAVSARTNRSTILLVELLSQTRGEKRVGYRRVELARPGRPPADASSGSRLILGALGIRRPKPKTLDASPVRKSANSIGGIRGRGAKHAQAPPAESTDSWDM